MQKNNYDEVAVARAKQFAAGQNLAHANVEKPAMDRLLPDLAGKKVLCLGCGTGEECVSLQARGATVYGFDNSEVSIEYARQHCPGVTFWVADMDGDLQEVAAAGPYDMVYSSLAIHYSQDTTSLLQKVYGMLVPGGIFLFSACHPVKWSAEAYRDPIDDTKKSFLMGYDRTPDSLRIYGDYLGEQKLTQTYPDGLHVEYYMRPPSAYFDLLQQTGFTVERFTEPTPTPETAKIDPVFWEINSKIPQWMLFRCSKPA